jgi:Flp pilus assembly protein TadG
MITSLRHRAEELWEQLSCDRRGAAAVLIALAATVLIGFTALGVEAGLWYAIKRQDQSAADAAALSGAYELAAGQTDGLSTVYADVCAKAQSAAAGDSFTFQPSYACPTASPGLTNPSPGTMYVNNPPVTGPSKGDNTAVEVFLSQQQKTFLADIVSPKLTSVTIGTRAVAKATPASLVCDLAVGTTPGTDITVQGSANINLDGCGLAANSSDGKNSPSISFGGGNNDVLNASWFQTVGSYNAGGNPQINVPTKLTYSAPVTDPYTCNPPQMGCAGKITYQWPSSQVFPTSPCVSITSGTTTLKPGWYGDSSNGSKGCSNGKSNASPPMSFTGGTAILCPGIYILDGEDTHGYAFLVQGGTVNIGTDGSGGCGVTGLNGVTIIASSKNGTLGGGFQIKSGTVILCAPVGGQPATPSCPRTGGSPGSVPSGCTFGSTPCMPTGVLFYQDPKTADTSKSGGGLTGDSTLTANGSTSLEGTLYTPATNVTFIGNSNSTCFLVIALTVTFTGDSTMAGNQASCKALGVTGPTVLNIALTE